MGRVTKTYHLIFAGEMAAEAVKHIGIYFIDGGGEDAIIENLHERGIKATRIYWAENLMSFKVSKLEK